MNPRKHCIHVGVPYARSGVDRFGIAGMRFERLSFEGIGIDWTNAGVEE